MGIVRYKWGGKKARHQVGEWGLEEVVVVREEEGEGLSLVHRISFPLSQVIPDDRH